MGDVNRGIPLPDNSTDLVNSRYPKLASQTDDSLIHAGVAESEWPAYLKEAHRILKPGTGWVQCVELGFPFAISQNDTLPKDAALYQVG